MTAFAFLFFVLSAVAAQQIYSNISLGSSLTPTTNSSWPSPSGLYAFGFFPQNNGCAVGIFVDKTLVWTANRDSHPMAPEDAILRLTSDGKLILQQGEGQHITDVISPPQSIASASMLDNGNFVLYDSHSRIIWQSFDHLTDTILPGQILPPGKELFSTASETDHSKGIFRLIMQDDGNLVQYPVNTPDTDAYAYYKKSPPGGHANITLKLENDDHLYLFSESSILLNITRGGYRTENTVYHMRLDVRGIFSLYSCSLNPQGNWIVGWSSTDDMCDPKGLCGLNPFCVLVDDVPDCKCLPGFDFVQPSNWTAGCTRNFSAEACRHKENKEKYEIRTVANTEWENNTYDVLDTATEEDCGRACLDDHNCKAAFFKDGQCTKQKLPLGYGRRSLGDSNVALVRVSTTTPGARGGVSGKEIKKETHLDILIISILLMILGVFVMSISFIDVFKKQPDFKKITEYEEVILIEDVALRAFTYADLVQAIENFKEELGKGASGTVYKGILQTSKKLVAVKRLEKEFAEGDREFQNEMKAIGKTYHRNLVRLLGYCLNGPNKLLVFEYMSNGSLADILFKPDKWPSWAERIKLARDIARGILYLHEECETQIIHCDIKPQNIQMDQHRCAKISDFGLAKLQRQDQTNTNTGIRGTKGYVAPEWHQK